MTSLEFILELFKVSADQLNVEYVKETPTRLQQWATKHKPPFVSLIDLSESGSVNNTQGNLITYDVAFVFVANLNKDPSTEQKIQSEIEADKLAKQFLWFVKRNIDTTVNSFTMSEFFRDKSYLGLGKGLSINLTVPDKDTYCDIYCNESTKDIDCKT